MAGGIQFIHGRTLSDRVYETLIPHLESLGAATQSVRSRCEQKAMLWMGLIEPRLDEESQSYLDPNQGGSTPIIQTVLSIQLNFYFHRSI